jgi:hypothetical protein
MRSASSEESKPSIVRKSVGVNTIVDEDEGEGEGDRLDSSSRLMGKAIAFASRALARKIERRKFGSTSPPPLSSC